MPEPVDRDFWLRSVGWAVLVGVIGLAALLLGLLYLGDLWNLTAEDF